jgi:predicted RNA-binding protein YlqC (UPF0109 family)
MLSASELAHAHLIAATVARLTDFVTGVPCLSDVIQGGRTAVITIGPGNEEAGKILLSRGGQLAIALRRLVEQAGRKNNLRLTLRVNGEKA